LETEDRVASLRLTIVTGVLLLNSCTDAGFNAPDPGSNWEASFDADIMVLAADYPSWPQVNRRADASAIGAYDVNIYIHGDAEQYALIHPGSTSPSQPMAAGTVIVREVLDATGNVAELTLMAKGPAGYDPTLGDWWFAHTDPRGQPLPDDTGGLQIGRMLFCHTCHIPRQDQDYLFGVPQADQQ
jgi:hypothetical protein